MAAASASPAETHQSAASTRAAMPRRAPSSPGDSASRATKQTAIASPAIWLKGPAPAASAMASAVVAAIRTAAAAASVVAAPRPSAEAAAGGRALIVVARCSAGARARAFGFWRCARVWFWKERKKSSESCVSWIRVGLRLRSRGGTSECGLLCLRVDATSAGGAPLDARDCRRRLLAARSVARSLRNLNGERPRRQRAQKLSRPLPSLVLPLSKANRPKDQRRHLPLVKQHTHAYATHPSA